MLSMGAGDAHPSSRYAPAPYTHAASSEAAASPSPHATNKAAPPTTTYWASARLPSLDASDDDDGTTMQDARPRLASAVPLEPAAASSTPQYREQPAALPRSANEIHQEALRGALLDVYADRDREERLARRLFASNKPRIDDLFAAFLENHRADPYFVTRSLALLARFDTPYKRQRLLLALDELDLDVTQEEDQMLLAEGSRLHGRFAPSEDEATAPAAFVAPPAVTAPQHHPAPHNDLLDLSAPLQPRHARPAAVLPPSPAAQQEYRERAAVVAANHTVRSPVQAQQQRQAPSHSASPVRRLPPPQREEADPFFDWHDYEDFAQLLKDAESGATGDRVALDLSTPARVNLEDPFAGFDVVRIPPVNSTTVKSVPTTTTTTTTASTTTAAARRSPTPSANANAPSSSSSITGYLQQHFYLERERLLRERTSLRNMLDELHGDIEEIEALRGGGASPPGTSGGGEESSASAKLDQLAAMLDAHEVFEDEEDDLDNDGDDRFTSADHDPAATPPRGRGSRRASRSSVSTSPLLSASTFGRSTPAGQYMALASDTEGDASHRSAHLTLTAAGSDAAGIDGHDDDTDVDSDRDVDAAEAEDD
ncbi:hypothetical protein H9P43_000262 [Blastocladiella emersonii ATCC 22665]|nr:hypothetical protein H9P43_000258 [Blastocladiella emersonii ATCC 22665]KAI9188840.1 hypothetical protein H9P43_000262 [Blastocladiella emersonii ATCC 22665]